MQAGYAIFNLSKYIVPLPYIVYFEVSYPGLIFMLYSPMGGNFFDSSMSFNKNLEWLFFW